MIDNGLCVYLSIWDVGKEASKIAFRLNTRQTEQPHGQELVGGTQ